MLSRTRLTANTAKATAKMRNSRSAVSRQKRRKNSAIAAEARTLAPARNWKVTGALPGSCRRSGRRGGGCRRRGRRSTGSSTAAAARGCAGRRRAAAPRRRCWSARTGRRRRWPLLVLLLRSADAEGVREQPDVVLAAREDQPRHRRAPPRVEVGQRLDGAGEPRARGIAVARLLAGDLGDEALPAVVDELRGRPARRVAHLAPDLLGAPRHVRVALQEEQHLELRDGVDVLDDEPPDIGGHGTGRHRAPDASRAGARRPDGPSVCGPPTRHPARANRWP